MSPAKSGAPAESDTPPRPFSVDDAVRAVLNQRTTEHRSFRNEDDMEGPRSAPDARSAPPAP